jgi:membrane protease YdiL (CAAX protease family)
VHASARQGSSASSTARLAECLIVFGALPLAYRLGLLPFRTLTVLDAVALAALAILLRDPTFDRRRLLGGAGARLRRELPGVALRVLGAAAVIGVAVLALDRSAMLDLPLHRRGLWLRLLVAYPVFSALPQELLYRVFFFQRYEGLFGQGRALVLASAAAFALMHVVFANVPAVALTLPAGLVLGWSYARTGSLALVAFEHTLYGILVFTLGLGRYFM